MPSPVSTQAGLSGGGAAAVKLPGPGGGAGRSGGGGGGGRTKPWSSSKSSKDSASPQSSTESTGSSETCMSRFPPSLLTPENVCCAGVVLFGWRHWRKPRLRRQNSFLQQAFQAHVEQTVTLETFCGVGSHTERQFVSLCEQTNLDQDISFPFQPLTNETTKIRCHVNFRKPFPSTHWILIRFAFPVKSSLNTLDFLC